jgi:hypothetical protein
MNPAEIERLQEIGQQINAGNYPRVFNDGAVALSASGVGVSILSAETSNEYRTQEPSASGSREGAASRSWPSGETEPPSGKLLRENYLGQLDAVCAAYPRTTSWLCDEGMWLSVESAVLAGLKRSATFLIAIPFRRLNPIRGWAFWTQPVGYEWIGPRHTNAVDGSICAFNPNESTWKSGGSLVELIDHYTIWALLHLHLELLGWWPGRQTAQFIYERLTELNDNEWCGCSADAKRYGECCKRSDLTSDPYRAALEFVGGFLQFKPRQPPASVLKFLRDRHDPPKFTNAGVDKMLLFGSCLCPVRNQRLPARALGILVPPLAAA